MRMVSYMHIMLKRHLAHLALDTIPFFDVGWVFPLKVLRQATSCIEFVCDVFYFGVVRWQR